MAGIDWAAIEKNPQAFADWIQGVQRGQAVAAGVDPIYAEASQRYGYLASYLNHPELGPILRKAAAEGWSAELLQGALSKTGWWQTHSAAAREFELLAATDIKTLQQKVHSKAMDLQAQAAKMGLHFDDWSKLTSMAEQVIKDPSMGEAEIAWMLGSQFHFSKTNPNPGGSFGTTMASLKQRANQYMLPMTDERAFRWSKEVAMGLADPQDLDNKLREQAKQKYAWLAKDLDTGATMKELFDTHIASVAQLLEVDADQVDLTDPKLRKIIETVDPATGERRSMTTTEAEEYIRGTAEYDTTKGAMNKAAAFAENLMRTFGKVAV